MNRTALRKRRFIVLGLVVAVLGIGFSILYVARNSARANIASEARIEGLAAHSAGDYDTTLQKLSYVLRNDRRDVEVLLAFAEARSRVALPNSRHVHEAVQIFNAALELEPDNQRALIGLLPLYEQLQRHIEWLGVAERILAFDPDNIEAIRLMALGNYIDSRFEAATEYILRLIELEPQNMQWRAMRLALLRDQDAPLDEILALCQDWIDGYNGDGRYHMLKAQVLVTVGRASSAQDAMQQAAKLGADDPEILRRMLSLLDLLQMDSDADDLIQLTKRTFPHEQWPHEAAVRRHWQAGQLQRAMDEIATAESALPAGESLDRELLRWKSLLLVLSENHDEANEVLEQLGRLADIAGEAIRDRDRAWVRAMQARMDRETQAWGRILETYTSALALAPADPLLNFLAGEAYAQLSEFELATASFERAHRSDPNWYAARISYSNALAQVGKPREACAILLEMIRRGEQRMTPYVLFARAWLAAEEPDDRIPGMDDARTGRPLRLVELLRRLHEAVPQSGELREVLVHAAARYGHRDLAFNVIRLTLDEPEPDPNLLLTLARISMAERFGMEEMLAERAQAVSDSITPPLAALLARIHHARGETDAGIAVIDDAAHALAAQTQDMAAMQRVRAAFLSEIDHPDAADALALLLDADDASGQAATFVLSQPVTWNHPELAERAIEALATVVGESSPRLAILRATFILYHRTDQPAELARAQSIVDQALQIAPDSLAAHSLMAQLAMTGDSPSVHLAIRHLERAVAAHPNHGDLYVRLIRLHQQQGNYAEAERYLTRLGSLAANRPALLRAEIELLERQGDIDRVVARLSQSLDDEATESERLLLFSRLHWTGRFAEAEALLREILESPERSELAIRLAVEFYVSMGRADDALALLSALGEAGVTQAILRGRFYQLTGMPEEAIASYKKALEFDPEHLEAIVHLGQLYALLGDERAAYDAALRGLKLQPDHGELQGLLLLTSVFLGEQEQRSAQAVASSSETVDPALVRVVELQMRVPGFVRRSVSAGQKPGEIRVTRAHLAESRALTERYPESLLVWSLAVDLHVAAGQSDEAIGLARQAAARLPNRAEPAQRAAHLLAQAGRYSEAIESARMWRQRTRNRPVDADVFLANMSLELERVQEAADSLSPYVARFFADHEREYERLRLWLYVQMRAGRAEQALVRLRPLFDGSGLWQSTWLELVLLLDEPLGRRAIQAIEPDLRDEPSWMLALASTWSHLAHRFDVAWAYDHAETYATQAVQRDENLQIPSLMIRAQNADWSGAEDKAMNLLQSARSLDPENAIILNNLADLIVRSGGDCNEAASLAVRAAELSPEIIEIINTHANAMLCLNDAAAAERLARRAVEQRPNSPHFLATLGLALAAQERWGEAQETLLSVERIVSESDEPATRPLRAKIDRLRNMVEVHAAVSMNVQS